MVSLGLLTLNIQLPGCTSLKETRGRLKPLLARLHREFGISACRGRSPGCLAICRDSLRAGQ